MDYDRSFKIIAQDSGPGLGRLAGLGPFDEFADVEGTLQTTERLADRAFVVRVGAERFVVYIEAYARWAESAVWNVLAKSALLSERERLPTVTIVFVLDPRGYHDTGGTFRLAAGGGPTQQLWFREVRLWEVRPEPWWDSYPGLMALTPLCAHDEPLGEVVTAAAQAIRRQSLDHTRRADLLTTLGIFGKFVDRSLDVFSIIGREEMRDNPLIQEFGLEFRQEGLQQGRQEGRQEGRQQATLTERRSAVRVIVETRFGPEAAAACEVPLGAITDLDRLVTLQRFAITAPDAAAVRAALEP